MVGTNRNSKGYDVINGAKLLWGDGMNEDTIDMPFYTARALRISADSIIAGSGGGLLQANLDRDTCKFAFKASNIIVDGMSLPIAKDPITDKGKQSKKGKMKLICKDNGGYSTITSESLNFDSLEDELQLVYLNGVLHNQTTMQEIRENVQKLN